MSKGISLVRPWRSSSLCNRIKNRPLITEWPDASASGSSFPWGRSPDSTEDREKCDEPDFNAQADETDQQHFTQAVRPVLVPRLRATVTCLPGVEEWLLHQHEPQAVFFLMMQPPPRSTLFPNTLCLTMPGI